MLLWTGIGSWRAEVSEVELQEDRLSAAGTQLGVDPLPYRLDYTVQSGSGFVTKRLDVVASGSGWRRRLDLQRDGSGDWTCEIDQAGEVDLPPPGGDVTALGGALDCDLGRCPLTNTMPVRRHDLHRRPGVVDFLMAWVSVPDLGVHPARQRYEHLRVDSDGTAVVHYVGAHRGFVGDLVFDREGLVITYPQLAQRVDA
jgi:uncharacterized protein